MTAILIILLLFAIGYAALWQFYLAPAVKNIGKKSENAVYIIALTAVSALVHVICAVKYQGHSTDMNCFSGWADMIFGGGISNFYASDAFTDYPPGYMYVLYVIGALKQLFQPTDGALWLLIKFPAILCDLLTGWLIYKIAHKRLGDGLSAAIAGAYLLNPAVILDSSLWGQVDSVYTLLVVLMLYLLTDKKMIRAYFVFAVCIFVKPQALMFTPLILFGIIENVLLPEWNGKKFLQNLIGGLCAIALLFLLALPFGIGNVINQYGATLASYPYLTVNAFNLWGALGQNWTDLSSAMSIVNYGTLLCIVLYSAYVFFKTKHEGKYYFCGAILSFVTYMLSVKMHDRYAFPTMVLLLVTFVYGLDIRSFILYAVSTLTQFFNTAWVLFIYEQDINAYFKSPVIVAASLVNMLLLIYFIAVSQKYFVHNTVSAVIPQEPIAKEEKSLKKEMHFKVSEKAERLNVWDYLIMAAIVIVYSVIAFYHLGDRQAPQTFTDIGEHAVEIDLGTEKDISKLKLYLGSYNLDDNRVLEIAYGDENGTEIASNSVDSGAVFYWSEIPVNEKARYIRLSTHSFHLTIMELGIMDNNGTYLTPVNANDSDIAPMFDEQALIPERTTYLNSTYFDEIYHARTGYEFVHSLDVYEWTHPPLGKDLIALGIKIFGMTPFGWRFMGTLFGVLMIPVLYLFARRFLKYQWAAALTTILFTFDFMHFAQTRIATIDVYVTFFIMLMYYFMYRYYRMSFYDTPIKKTLIPLALSGISMGLGIASKWTGIYAGTGLGILFFMTLYKRYSEYLYAKQNPEGSTDGISHQHVIRSFIPNLRLTILWCCIFFVFVPMLIYGLSYIPYLKAPSSHGLKTIIENQSAIYAYHSKTVVESTHPFSSHWYEWIIMRRPIWYYSGEISDTVKEGISAFGNPLVWWVGIPAFILMVYMAITKKDKKAWFLIVAYVIQIVFWIPVTRTTFIYHYFPCVPFLTLMIGYCMQDIYDETADTKILRFGSKKQLVIVLCCVYTAAAVGLFAMFYPVLSGAPCSVSYAQNWLKWFDSWVLLST